MTGTARWTSECTGLANMAGDGEALLRDAISKKRLRGLTRALRGVEIGEEQF